MHQPLYSLRLCVSAVIHDFRPGPVAWLAILLAFVHFAIQASADDSRRMIVRVEADEIGDRPGDERPAELSLAAADFGAAGIDLATLEIVRWDTATNRAIGGPLPARWYDDSIPYDFPEFEYYAENTDGLTMPTVNYPRWGDYYNLFGDGRSGRLVWLHRQIGGEAADYAVSFDTLPAGDESGRIPPKGFVGDGSHRCAETGSGTTGMIHSRITVADFTGDGLTDLIVGGARGAIVVYPNLGSRERPEFTAGRLLCTEDGKPIDVGWSAAPLAVDWDGDGRTDLLCGAESNRVLFFQNVGENARPRLVARGFVLADGRPIELPIEPIPKSPAGIYIRDYYPVLDAPDLNGDGRRDLLAGGYVTGRVYYFEQVDEPGAGSGDSCTTLWCDAPRRNSRRGASCHDSTLPRLAARGPIEADGKPLNVGDWAAAPTTADFDSDGDLDLVSGNMPLNEGGGDSASADRFLRYWENAGSATEPRFTERPFPKSGEFPNASLATPRAWDFNGDGCLDLAVSAGEQIYLFENGGTPSEPRFAAHAVPLPGVWGGLPLPTFGAQFLDFDGDGATDILSGVSVYLRQPTVAGASYDTTGRFQPVSLLAEGNRIEHVSPRGDAWAYTQLADLNGDGALDLLFGAHEGHVFLHANLGGSPPRYEESGIRLETEGSGPIQVGPAAGGPIDFDYLQGARTTLAAADFDADGLVDLVVGDTFGKLRQYRNLGPLAQPRFAEPVEIGDQKIRNVPYAADWDGDGKLDVVGSAANGLIDVYKNLGDGRFAAGASLAVPPVPYSPMASVVDWNSDGDLDLVLGTAYGYSCWFERSFLEGGYAKAKRVGP